MSTWQPKTSRYGVLPDYTYETRDTTPLDKMFYNSFECVTDISKYVYPVMVSDRIQGESIE